MPLDMARPMAYHYDAGSHKFTGKERDSESGLDNFGARYNSSSMGRFMSPDPINLTAKRLVNPANTLNKYVYGGNNPLLYIDPTGKDITFFYRRSGLSPLDQGHFALTAINQATGQTGTLNFVPTARNPNTIFSSVPGANPPLLPSETATEGTGFASLTIRTTPEEAQRVIQWINQVSANPPDYSLFTSNCTTMCEDAMQILGVDLDAGLFGFHPDELWDAVFMRYSDTPAFVTSHAPFQAGRDFGNPRYRGINTYQLADLYYRLWLFQGQSQQKACTTILVPDGKGGSKSETNCN
jgi:RHS repeat-associated protein